MVVQKKTLSLKESVSNDLWKIIDREMNESDKYNEHVD